MLNSILKYPRTKHIEGSRCQPGDENLDSVPFSKIANRFLVVEEKVDGANCGISFSDEGELLLQSRGHYLTGGGREKHFNLFKTWANAHSSELFDILEDRYIMYGEWLYAKHTVFYDKLPHYFMEFDIWDKAEEKFLSTERRKEMLKDYPFIVSVLVLYEGRLKTLKSLTDFVGRSNFISDEAGEKLREICNERGLSIEQVVKETDLNNTMEGLYIKVEEDGEVKERYKYVRASFLTSILNSESHWLERPIVPNALEEEVDLF
jgi:RNA ligase